MEGAKMKRSIPARPVSEPEARYWADRGTIYDPREGQVLAYAGHRPPGVFVLLAGRLRLVREGGGRRRRAGDIVAPAVVGEGVLSAESTCPLTVEAGSGVRVAFVPAARWRDARAEGGYSRGV